MFRKGHLHEDAEVNILLNDGGLRRSDCPNARYRLS